MTELPSGTVTFLMTDIEGSTALWERHSTEMRDALRQHDEIVADAVAAHNGWLIKSRGEGDSAFCVFAEPLDALLASIALQHRLQQTDWNLPEPLRLRMALHTGEAELRGGDYFGNTVNRCARLRAIAHGGQTLLSESSAHLTRDRLPDEVALRDCGFHRLRDLTEPEHVFELRHSGLADDFPPLRSLDQSRHNLPLQAVPLVGREREMSEIRARLLGDDVRLLTLTGPGGIGKTRLGLQVAADLSDQFSDGVFFVNLSAVSDPALVLPAIAQALGIRENSARPLLDVINDFLAGKSLLVLLDNFEQVLPAAADVSSLLTTSPGLKVLVTSRSVLSVTAEHIYPVPTLSLPPEKATLDVPELETFEAVRLFVDRARAVRPGFELTDENASAVRSICRHLDGLPLAIELAAARIRLLSPQAMVKRLTSALPLLTGGARDVPTRQQTLSGAIAWSYDLLGENERALFRRLSVFAGGFTLEAAETVAGGSTDSSSPVDVLDGLAVLVNASLLEQRETDDGEPRFRMLGIIREYGLGQLETQGELPETGDRHAAYYLELAEAAEPHLQGPDQVTWFGQLQDEHDNLRAALGWYRSRDDHERYLRLAGSLFWFWFGYGYWSEALAWYEDALKRCPDRTQWRAKALYGAGLLCRAHGDYPGARKRFDECIEIARDVGDQRTVARALHLLGGVATSEGHLEKADQLLNSSLEIAKEIDDGWTIAVVTRDLGGLASEVGDTETARAYLEESVRIHRDRGERWAQAHAQNALGDFLRSRAMLDEAEGAYQESLRLFSALGTSDGRPSVLHNLAYVALNQANVQEAARLFQESLSMFQELGDLRGIAECLVGFGAVLSAAGHPDEAARMFGAGEAIFESSGTQISLSNQRDYERNRELVFSAMGEEGFARLFDAGRSMSRDIAIQHALSMDVASFEPPEP